MSLWLSEFHFTMKPGGNNLMVAIIAKRKKSEKTAAEKTIFNLADDEFGDIICHSQGCGGKQEKSMTSMWFVAFLETDQFKGGFHQKLF
jgi:hypothetical protein